MTPDLEWLETDGAGGLFCSTISGELRRRWHGWWVAQKPPRRRVQHLAGLLEWVTINGRQIALSAVPEGDTWIPPEIAAAFTSWPMAKWVWRFPEGTLTKEVFLPRFKKAAINRWSWDGDADGSPIEITFRPLLPEDRSAHDLRFLLPRKKIEREVKAKGKLRVTMEIEKDCEDTHHADLYAGEDLKFTLEDGETIHAVWAVPPRQRMPMPAELYAREVERRGELPRAELHPAFKNLQPKLAHAADQFVVYTNRKRPSMMAGYPWFTDWGRDTMISLRGICISAGRIEEARDIIRHFLSYEWKGLIPNLFPEQGLEVEHNTVDATLWLIEMAFRAWTPGELAADEKLWEHLRHIIKAHIRGTENDIHMDADGLLSGGAEGTQLTWMDIKIDGHVPTPRHGKPIEIQALWYNALRLMANGAAARGSRSDHAEWSALALAAETGFRKRFFDGKRVADVIDRDYPGEADWAIRANMVLPFYLQHNIIPDERREAVLRLVAKELLTPRGLRSLSAGDPAYKGVYRGNRQIRDRAYHQGTVWMWLIMPYLHGVYTERKRVKDLYRMVPRLLNELEHHFLYEGCCHQANEVFDGDAPHNPRGCFGQAWSVAALVEVLRLPWDELKLTSSAPRS